jgi:hypothetical protein
MVREGVDTRSQYGHCGGVRVMEEICLECSDNLKGTERR